MPNIIVIVIISNQNHHHHQQQPLPVDSSSIRLHSSYVWMRVHGLLFVPFVPFVSSGDSANTGCSSCHFIFSSLTSFIQCFGWIQNCLAILFNYLLANNMLMSKLTSVCLHTVLAACRLLRSKHRSLHHSVRVFSIFSNGLHLVAHRFMQFTERERTNL